MQSASNSNFMSLGIAPRLLQILDQHKFVIPTQIQAKAIPICVEGKDIIGIAQTGTGKTLAFCLPMLQRLAAQPNGMGLVLVPTRELALQVFETFQKIGQPFHTRSAVLIGGASMNNQITALRKKPRVIIATPGRLLDHMEQRTVDLKKVSILVLDEADRMLDMGFAPQIERVLRAVPQDRQTLLFSATMPTEIVRMAKAHMKLPLSVEIAPAGTASERITQELFIVKKEYKSKLLQKILGQYHGAVLVFSRTKVSARYISRAIREMGHQAAEIHSDRSLGQRREALEGFKTGKYRVLVATDIAARGIDVKGIELVVNYDLPDEAENYIHRIGRTGRAGHEGHAVSFATPDQGLEVRRIEQLMRSALPISEHPEIPMETFLAGATRKPGAPTRIGGSGGYGKRSFGGRRFRR